MPLLTSNNSFNTYDCPEITYYTAIFKKCGVENRLLKAGMLHYKRPFGAPLTNIYILVREAPNGLL